MTANVSTVMAENSDALVENILIPLRIVKRGSHRGKVLSSTYSTEKEEPDEILVNGLLKAYLWEKIVYEQFDGNLELFCLQNKFSRRRQILRLNILSPKIKEAILNGKHPKNLLLRDLIRKPFSDIWEEQEKGLGV